MVPKKVRAVILIGGPCKGTRFRPLSLELPKPMFPIGGFPIIQHHIETFSRIPGLMDIILLGFYQPDSGLTDLLKSCSRELKIPIRYIQEYASLGTAGGIYHFRDQLTSGGPELLFVMNGDICCDLPLLDLLSFHQSLGSGDRFVIMATEATPDQSTNYGCIVEDPTTHEVIHYVEKPQTFVNTLINCGVYLFTPGIIKFLRVAFGQNRNGRNTDFNPLNNGTIHLERDVYQSLARSGTLFVYKTDRFWSQIKFAGAVIYANRHVLASYERNHPSRLARASSSSSLLPRTASSPHTMDQLTMNGSGDKKAGVANNTSHGPTIIGHVFIHPTARIDKSAVLGPNVSIGERAHVQDGVRLRDCIVLRDAQIRSHACCMNAVIGWNSVIGEWARVEGTPNDPDPNKPFAKLDVLSVFNAKGQLNPSITVIGSSVEVPPEVIVLNCIILPHKELDASSKNQIIL